MNVEEMEILNVDYPGYDRKIHISFIENVLNYIETRLSKLGDFSKGRKKSIGGNWYGSDAIEMTFEIRLENVSLSLQIIYQDIAEQCLHKENQKYDGLNLLLRANPEDYGLRNLVHNFNFHNKFTNITNIYRYLDSVEFYAKVLNDPQIVEDLSKRGKKFKEIEKTFKIEEIEYKNYLERIVKNQRIQI